MRKIILVLNRRCCLILAGIVLFKKKNHSIYLTHNETENTANVVVECSHVNLA